MDLEHTFTVPVAVDAAWAEFQDIGSIAECFPGAQVTSVEDDSFSGSVKVRLGPISLVYNGSGTFTEKDDANHRFVVDAKGKDRRGNGTAGATVTLTMTGTGESTDVNVHTDLAITGKPAQFGRGVMQDVSDKLLGQFVGCLEQRFNQGGGGGAAAVEAPAPVEPTVESTSSHEVPSPPVAESTAAPADETPASVAPATPPPAATPRPATPPTASGSGDALDLGKTVLPVLAKSYWKQAVVVLIVIIVVIWLIAR